MTGPMSAEHKFIAWLVDEAHYPFDVTFDTPPPVDHRDLAAYWNRTDGWGITDEDAYLTVMAEIPEADKEQVLLSARLSR